MRNFSAICTSVLLASSSLVTAASAEEAPRSGQGGEKSGPKVEETAKTTAPEPNVDATERARAEFNAGVVAYDAGDFSLAAKHFATAHELKPHPDVLLNLAQSELLAARYVDAAKHFSLYVEVANNAGSPGAAEGLKQALSHVAELSVSAPLGAEISVDGELVGKAPLPRPIFLAPGEHEVASGDVTKPFIAQAGEKHDMTLEHAAPPPAAVTAVTESPPEPTGEGRRAFHEWYLDTPLALFGTGLAAVSFTTSAIAAVTASRRYDQSNDAASQIRAEAQALRIRRTPCGPPAANSEFANACSMVTKKSDDGDTWATISVVALIGGGVLSGAVVGYYFIDPAAKKTSTTSAWLLPQVSRDRLGLSVSGRF